MHTVLSARSDFSIGESILSTEELVKEAQAVNAKAVALTDTMSVTGLIDFTNRAKKAEIKPIIGCRLRLVDDPAWRKTKEDKKAPAEYYLTYYVLSEKGLVTLFKLLSLANTEDRFYNNAKLSFDDLFEALKDVSKDDVAVASGNVYSVLHHKNAREILQKLSVALSASNTFLSLIPINSPLWDTLNKKAVDFAEELGLPLLADRPVLYKRGDADAAEIMHAVCKNNKLTDPWHLSPHHRDLHAMPLPEFCEELNAAAKRLQGRGVGSSGKYFKAALVNTAKLEQMVNYTWSKAKVSLPEMAPDEFAALVAECKKGWVERFAQPVFEHKPSAEELRDIYKPRLNYELETLKRLGFAGYFLLVQDVVRFAKTSGILVGPGRGSVGGSLVAYLMGITDCDPVRFGLLFERFINPDRIDLPDADLDFMSERRHEVIEYLINKYGEKRVAGISNFGALQAASSIRGVGKAFGLPEKEYSCSKYAPKLHGQNIELSKSADMVAEIGAFRDTNPAIWNVCVKLEGTTNIMGRHAAGVVVGGCDLVERAVIERRADGPTINWDKRIVEEQGLVKMDILGLRTLDLIDAALKYIRVRHPSKRVDLMRIALDDPKVLENFANAVTTGVFQFESGGMRRLLKEIAAGGNITFDDITAATALYRPGPMDSGMMDSYYLRKQGNESIEYDHPLMRDVLATTYGVMVYQEQIMTASRLLAGYSAPDADKLRKIMGKKLPEEMAKERGKFVDGCVKTVAMDKDFAAELFDKIEKFAGYGFNKSHSVEYTLISYQSMWLKTYYPVEFFAAALSLMDEDKLPALLKEAERLGVEIKYPDINTSTDRFEILTDTMLSIPFTRIKGVGEKTAHVIMDVRKAGKFNDLADFKARITASKVGRFCHKGHIEKLEKVGAFASIEPTSLSSKHPDRIKEQRELMPALVTDTVPIARFMEIDKLLKNEIAKVVHEYRGAHAEDGMPVMPTIGKTPRFMVINDCPSKGEEEVGKMSYGRAFGYVQDALAETGLARSDGYWTALIKRPKEGKQVSPEEITTYYPYLEREILLLKPPVIILLGSAVVRHFFPDFKGKASDSAGKVVYSPKLDANVIIGFNPGEIYHDPDKQNVLNEVFKVAGELTE